jgi:hypothetical protein
MRLVPLHIGDNGVRAFVIPGTSEPVNVLPGGNSAVNLLPELAAQRWGWHFSPRHFAVKHQFMTPGSERQPVCSM